METTYSTVTSLETVSDSDTDTPTTRLKIFRKCVNSKVDVEDVVAAVFAGLFVTPLVMVGFMIFRIFSDKHSFSTQTMFISMASASAIIIVIALIYMWMDARSNRGWESKVYILPSDQVYDDGEEVDMNKISEKIRGMCESDINYLFTLISTFSHIEKSDASSQEKIAQSLRIKRALRVHLDVEDADKTIPDDDLLRMEVDKVLYPNKVTDTPNKTSDTDWALMNTNISIMNTNIALMNANTATMNTATISTV